MNKTHSFKSLPVAILLAMGMTLSLSVTTTSAATVKPLMFAQVKRKSNTQQTITYSKIKGATSYEVYGAKCGQKFKKYGNAKGTKFTALHRNKKSTYKYYVVAKKGKTVLAKSNEVHATVVNSTKKTTNAKSVTVTPKTATVKAGKTVTIKATVKGFSKKKAVFFKGHTKKVRFYSSNKSVATVDAKGKVSAKKSGKVTIYAVASNGVKASSKVTVTGKATNTTTKSNFVPSKTIQDVVVNVIPTTNNNDAKKAAALLAKKNTAKEDLANKAKAVKVEIAKLNLTDAQKSSYNKEVDNLLEEGNKAINNANDEAAVTSAFNTYKDKMEAVVTGTNLDVKANDAKAELTTKANEVKASIDELNLTDAQKASYKNKVNDLLTEGKGNINNAETEAKVTEALNTAKAKMAAVVTSDTAVDVKANDAKDELATKATAVKAAIDDLNLTDDQKTTYKNKVNDLLTEGNENIDNAETEAKVTEELNTAKNKMEAVVTSDTAVDVKANDAKDELTTKATSVKTTIDGLDLTDAQKTTYKNKVNDLLTEGKENINNADTEEKVTEALNTAKTKMADVVTEAKVAEKAADAKDELTAKVTEVKNAIDASDLSDEKKASYKAEVDDLLTDGNDAIDDADTEAKVATALSTAKSNMDAVATRADLEAYYNSAKEAVKNKADEVKENITNDGDLINYLKDFAKSEVDRIKDEEFDAIDSKLTKEAINEEKENALARLTEADNDHYLAALRYNGIAGTKSYRDSTRQSIQNYSGLTDEQKTELTTKVDNAATTALDAINAATTEAEIRNATSDFTNVIASVYPTATLYVAQNNAKAKIDEAVATANTTIDNSTELTESQKTAAKANVSTLATEGKAKVAAATTANDATTEGDTAATAITTAAENAEVAALQISAREALDAKAEELKNTINNANYLTEDQKTELKDNVDTANTEAKTNVGNATTAEAIDTAKTNGLTAIEENTPVAAESVSVSGSATVGFGKTTTLTANVAPATTTNKAVKWSSSDPTIATVDENTGVVTGNSNNKSGTVVITATTSNGKTVTYNVEVKEVKVTITYKVYYKTSRWTSAEIYTANVEYTQGEKLGTLKTYEEVAGKAPMWYDTSGSYWKYVQMNDDMIVHWYTGRVTDYYGMLEKTSETPLSTEDIATSNATYYAFVDYKTKITMKNKLHVKRGNEEELEATVSPDTLEDQSLTWTSDNEDVATVDEDGYVTGVSNGTATITATAFDGTEATCVVTVDDNDNAGYYVNGSYTSWDDLVKNKKLVVNNGKLTSAEGLAKGGKLIVDDSVTSIGSGVLCLSDYYVYQHPEKMSRVKDIVLPSSVTTIDNKAFEGAYTLETINLDNVTSIGNYAFKNCTAIQNVNIDSLTSMGQGAFFGCSELKAITIPSAITAIPVEAFRECYDLETVNLPNTLTSIKQSAFMYCDSIGELTLPDSVKTIEQHAFFVQEGSPLDVTIPDTVESMNGAAFLNAYKIHYNGPLFSDRANTSKLFGSFYNVTTDETKPLR